MFIKDYRKAKKIQIWAHKILSLLITIFLMLCPFKTINKSWKHLKQKDDKHTDFYLIKEKY